MRILVALVLLAGAAQAQSTGGAPAKEGAPAKQERSAEPQRKRDGEPPPSGPREQQSSDATDQGKDDDEDLAARALERSLVQRGAQLLPVWGAELEPELVYAHTGSDTVVTLPAGPISLRSRIHDLTGVLTFRLGLPWEAQVDASLPFRRVARDLVFGGGGDAPLGAGVAHNYTAGAGFGDPHLALNYLLRSRQTVPDLLITVSWKPPLGTSPYESAPGQIGLGSGFHSVGAAFTVSKAVDPLVYLAGLSYIANLTVDTSLGRLQPGDSWGLRAGTILAVSAEASMSFLLDFDYTAESRFAGSRALGTDRTIATLELGLAMVVSRRTLLSFAVDVGLTADAPDVQMRVAVPVRF